MMLHTELINSSSSWLGLRTNVKARIHHVKARIHHPYKQPLFHVKISTQSYLTPQAHGLGRGQMSKLEFTIPYTTRFGKGAVGTRARWQSL